MRFKKIFGSMAISVLLASTLNTATLAATNGYGTGIGREVVPRKAMLLKLIFREYERRKALNKPCAVSGLLV